MEGFASRRGLVPVLGLVFVVSTALFVASFAVPWYGAGVRDTPTGDPVTTWYDKGELSTRAVASGAVTSGTEGVYLRDGASLASFGLALAAVVTVGWIALRLAPISRTRTGAWLNASLAAGVTIGAAFVVAGSARFIGYTVTRLSDGATTTRLGSAGLLWAVSIPGIVFFLLGLALLVFAAYVGLREGERALGASPPARGDFANPRRLFFYGAVAALAGAAVLNLLPWTSLAFNAPDATGAMQEARFAVDRGRLEALAATTPGTILPAGGIAYTAAMQGTVRDMVSNLDLARTALLWASAGLLVGFVAWGILEQARAPVMGRLAIIGASLLGGLSLLAGLVALVSAALHVNDLNAALIAGGAPTTTRFGVPWNATPALALVAALGIGGYAILRTAPGSVQEVLDRAQAAEVGATVPVKARRANPEEAPEEAPVAKEAREPRN